MISSVRPSVAFNTLQCIAGTYPATLRRSLSTLPSNQHIVSPECTGVAFPDLSDDIQYVHEQKSGTKTNYVYSYLPTSPPNPSLSIGSSLYNPPTADSLTENPEFISLLHHVVSANAVNDPDVQAQATMYASQAGSALGSGGVFFPQQRKNRKPLAGGGSTGGDGAGGASAQGGMGGAGRGGYIHVSDQRNPPDFGRVAWPEDILGSLELDGDGKFVDGTGRYQKSGTYRVVTNEGVLGLSKHLRERVVERLKELEEQAKTNG